MLFRLSEDQYHLLSSVEQLKSFPIIAAVLERSQSGSIFVDSISQPELIFIISKSAFGYLFTPPHKTDYADIVHFFVHELAIPNYFHLYDAPVRLNQYLSSQQESTGYKVRKRKQMRYMSEKIDPEVFKPGLPLTPHEIKITDLDSLSRLGLDLEHKFWNSGEHFISNGFGIYLEASEGSKPISICYAACVANGFAEVDILTDPEFLNNGLGKYSSALFVQLCLTRRITPNWDCFEDNKASFQTAKKLGFAEVKDYMLTSIFLKSRSNITN